MSRKTKSIKNFGVAIIGQSLGLIISFVARVIFIRILGGEYLGLNGLFANILMVLSLAELGVGEAIIYSLYRPLANRDYSRSKMLMDLYRKVYIAIGLAIILMGISLTPFLSFFINDMPQIEGISLIYVLFVINTGVSYFFSYKRNLIIADQNRYIATIYRYGFYFLLNVFQIIYLIIARDYIGFLVLQIVFTVLENIFVSRKANKMYPFLVDKDKTKLDKETKHELSMNIKAMMMHRVGGTIVSSTDNILLSKFVGLVEVGMYSNYYLITNALGIVFGQFYSSILASVGNLCVKGDPVEQFEMFRRIDFLGFLIHCLSSVFLVSLFNPIISLWVGSDFAFRFDIVLVIIINFYLAGMRKSVLTFREASGLFYKDRWKAVIEAVVNLVVSIILAINLGALGVFLGTLISSVTVCVWVEPYILFKYAFRKSVWVYFKQYFKYLIFTVYVSTLSFFATSLLGGVDAVTIIIKALICLAIYLINIVLFFGKDKNLAYFRKLFVEYVKKIMKRIRSFVRKKIIGIMV